MKKCKNIFKHCILFFFLACNIHLTHAQCSSIDFKATSATEGCALFPVNFAASGAPSGSTYDWNFGSGFLTGKADTITGVFSSAGTYTVVMIAHFPNGDTCRITKKSMIKVHPALLPVMYISDKKVCDRFYDVTNFIDSTPNSVSREWVIEGVKYNAKNLNYGFSHAGSQKINITVKNNIGCLGSLTKTLPVYDSLSTDICATITVYPTYVSVAYSPGLGNLSGRTVKGYKWSFPGGSITSSTAANPTVTYPDVTKKYDVLLTVYLNDGCLYTMIRKGFISKFMDIGLSKNCPGVHIIGTVDMSDTGRHNYQYKFPGAAMIDISGTPMFNPSDVDHHVVSILYDTLGTFPAQIVYHYAGSACSITVNYPQFTTLLGPRAFFTSHDNQFCVKGDTVHFINLTDTTQSYGVKYTWTISDSNDQPLKKRGVLGPTSSLDTFWVPPALGSYGVTLVAKGAYCTSSYHVKGLITAAVPKSGFLIPNPVGCFGSTIKLLAKASPSNYFGYRYFWTAQNESDTTIFNKNSFADFSFIPRKPGLWDVDLIISNLHCLADSFKKRALKIIGDNTGIVVGSYEGCMSPDYTTTASIGPEDIYPNDPNNPPVYHWFVLPSNKQYVKFSNPDSKKTNVTITKEGCYYIYLDIIVHQGKDTCKTTYESPNQICTGIGLGFAVAPLKCLNDTIAVTNFTDPTVNKVKWKVEPAGLATILPSDTSWNVKIIFKKETCYKVQLTGSKLIHGSLCSDTGTQSVCMVLPTVDFTTSTPTAYCAPAITRFKSTNSNAVNFLWIFGDGDSLPTPNDSASHVYQTLKTKDLNVKLIVTDKNGCVSSTTKNGIVKVIGPIPSFTMNKTSNCDSLDVTFTNTSNNVPKFLFFYDDGSPPLHSTNPPKHHYALQDTSLPFVVFHPAMQSIGDTFCRPFFVDSIVVYRSPKDIRIKPDLTSGCIPFKVHFNAVSNSATSWKWDFDGDGKIDDSIHQNPEFTYTKPGIYRVKITVTNRGNCTYSTFFDSIVVLNNAESAYIPSSHKICGKAEIRFINTSKSYQSFVFDYGDGSPKDTNNIKPHTYYFDPGKDLGTSKIFYPEITVYAGKFCRATFRDSIIAYRLPNAGFTSSKIYGCSPLSLRFRDTSTSGFGAEWDFDNDGITDAYGKVVDWTFKPGIYSVKLKSFTKNGCVDSVIKVNLITVNESPVANFVASDSDICFGDTISFKNLTVPAGNTYKWAWKFNDPLRISDTSTMKDPTYKYMSVGVHALKLIATDNKGCTGTVQKIIKIEDTLPPKNSNLLYVSVLDTDKVFIKWKQNPLARFKNYLINRTDAGTPSVIYTTSRENDTSLVYQNNLLKTSATSYCFSMQTNDLCNKISFATYSHCTIVLTGIARSGPQNILSWTSYRGWAPGHYYIYRAQGAGTFSCIDSVGGSSLTYTDTNLCTGSYCYYVEAKQDSSLFLSRSNKIYLNAKYVALSKPVNLKYATVEGNSFVRLYWDTIAFKNLNGYQIDKYNIKTGWKDAYAHVLLNTYLDSVVNVNQETYNYHIRTIDKCGYTGPESNNGSSILLRENIQHDNVALNWNAYRKWKAGVKYYKVQIRSRTNQFKTIATISDTFYVDDSVYLSIDTAYCYRVLAYEKGISTDSSLSNQTCAVLPSRMFVPNAFTPGNGDGLNDVWKVYALSVYNIVGNELTDFSIKVFNRWGTVIFETNNIHTGWDGTFKGKPIPEGVYIYMIDASGVDGRNLHLKGNITLIR